MSIRKKKGEKDGEHASQRKEVYREDKKFVQRGNRKRTVHWAWAIKKNTARKGATEL